MKCLAPEFLQELEKEEESMDIDFRPEGIFMEKPIDDIKENVQKLRLCSYDR